MLFGGRMLFGTSFADGFLRFKESEDLADVVVATPLGEFRLHSLVLANRSEFFYKAFTADFKESKAKRIELQFEGGAEAWPALLQYFYTDRISLEECLVMPLLAMARQLIVPPLEKYCSDFIRECLSESNCLSYLRDAIRFGESFVQKDCIAYAACGTSLCLVACENCAKHKRFVVCRFLHAAQ
jgi:BTB/POZ domain